MDKYIHVPIKDLLSNPFRRIEHYPIRREKVEALKESIEKTGFWDNLLVRSAKNGKFERAFGEHRATALKEYFDEHPKEDRKVGVIVRDLSDADMIQIMARENMEEWGATSGIVEIETVHAVVLAYADGRIQLSQPERKAPRLRYAPSFAIVGDDVVVQNDNSKPYTAISVARFLGWSASDAARAADKVHTALTALQFLDEGLLGENDLVGLSYVANQGSGRRGPQEIPRQD